MRKPIVVVGAGIVGSAIAYELQKRGEDVVLVDRDLEPHGASAFSFASLSAFDEPLRDVYLLKSQGIVRWREWQKELGTAIGVRWGGEIRWAEERHAAEELHHLTERAVGRGYPVRRITESGIRDLLPGSAPGRVLAATYAPDDGQADPVAAIDVLTSAFVDRGGTIAVGRANLIFGEDDVTVRVGDDDVRADTVIIAAGAETAGLLERFGWEIPMDSSPGLLVLTEPTVELAPGVVYAAPASGAPIHLRQQPDGRAVIGERSQSQVARSPSRDHAELLLRQAQRSFPGLAGVGVDHFTVDWRPMPRDGMPIIGPLPGMPSLYMAVAHGGVTLAPVIAELVAVEVVEKRPEERLASFRLDRFARRAADADVSLEAAYSGRAEVFLG